MYPETVDIPVPQYPEYAGCTNMVLVIPMVLKRFNAAIGTDKFHWIHEEQPAVIDLIARGQAIVDDHTSDLDALEEWMPDVAIIAPRLWD